MSEQKSILQQFMRDIDTGKASASEQHVHDSYDDHNPAPFASKTPGMQGRKETYDIALGIFSDFKHVVEDQISEGDRVASRIVGTGRHVGPLLGIPASNNPVTMSGIAIHRVAGGKLVEHWGQVDALALLTQVGAMPAPPPLPPTTRDASFQKRSDSTPVSRDEMKRLVRVVFDEGINGRNMEALKGVIHPQYVNHSLPSGAVGLEGLSRAVNGFLAAFPDLHITLEDLVAEDNKVATRGYATGTHQGTFLNVPPTGKSIRMDFIDIWHGYDGQLLDNWVQLDMVGALVQMGAMPDPRG
jgi:predicted ester cyclase